MFTRTRHDAQKYQLPAIGLLRCRPALFGSWRRYGSLSALSALNALAAAILLWSVVLLTSVVFSLNLAAAEPTKNEESLKKNAARTLTTLITHRGESLTGVVIDRHVFHLTVQFYHDGEPMGSRDIRYDAIREERDPTADEAAASGYPLTALPTGQVVARPYDPRDPASVLSRMQANKAAIDALAADNEQLTQRYLSLVGRVNAQEIQAFWQWARRYTARDRADDLLAAASNAADFAKRLEAYNDLKALVGSVRERPAPSDVRAVLQASSPGQAVSATWPEAELMQRMLSNHERWRVLLDAPTLQVRNLDSAPVREHSIVVWETARWRSLGAKLPVPKPAPETVEAAELALFVHEGE